MEKVQIRAFTDTELTKEVTKKPLLLPVNPESFNRTLKVELKEEQGQGSQGSNPEYVLTLPEELSFEFVFDGTGTIEGYAFADPNDKSVKKQLEIFLATVYNMDGDIHKPYYLKVQWGQLIFPCMLSNLDLNYNLFLDNGDPLRVKANATFKQYISLKKRSLDEGKKSPDLTHVRSVKAGDRLDLMTNKIYNDSKYVAQIAKANGLTTIRKIKPGKDLVFPPLDKTEQN